MSVRGRALRFDLPSPEQTLEGGGLRLGLDGSLATVEGAAAIRQAILLLLSTERGERLGRPTYGCDLRELAFAPNDDTTAGLAVHMVRQAIEEWEPRVRIVSVGVDRPDADPGLLLVRLEYEVVGSGRLDVLDYPVSTDGRGA